MKDKLAGYHLIDFYTRQYLYLLTIMEVNKYA
jgi:hypothetical protein